MLATLAFGIEENAGIPFQGSGLRIPGLELDHWIWNWNTDVITQYQYHGSTHFVNLLGVSTTCVLFISGRMPIDCFDENKVSILSCFSAEKMMSTILRHRLVAGMPLMWMSEIYRLCFHVM